MGQVFRVRIGDYLQDPGGKATLIQRVVEAKHEGHLMRSPHYRIAHPGNLLAEALNQVLASGEGQQLWVLSHQVFSWVRRLHEAFRDNGAHDAVAGWERVMEVMEQGQSDDRFWQDLDASAERPKAVNDLVAPFASLDGFLRVIHLLLCLPVSAERCPRGFAGLTEVAARGFGAIDHHFLSLIHI